MSKLKLYEYKSLNLQKIHSECSTLEQCQHFDEITAIIQKWSDLKLQYPEFKKPEVENPSLYSFDIDAHTFISTFEELVGVAVQFNTVCAFNRTQLIIRKAKELLEDYSFILRAWRGPQSGVAVVPLELGSQHFTCPLECMWALKIIFSLCPHGDSHISTLEYFYSMVIAVEAKNYKQALECAHKIQLEKFDLEYLTSKFGILSKILHRNLELGFLQKSWLEAQ